jgi:hypothetical protein
VKASKAVPACTLVKLASFAIFSINSALFIIVFFKS